MVSGYEYDILMGIVFLVIILLSIVAILLDKYFPKNRISKRLGRIADWIKDNVRI